MNAQIIDEWLAEAKKSPNADKIGMYLTHNGVVRATPRTVVRHDEIGSKAGDGTDIGNNKLNDGSCLLDTTIDCNDSIEIKPESMKPTSDLPIIKNVNQMEFSYDAELVEKYITETQNMDGIYYVRAWLNEGLLNVGDDIMYVLIGGDIRPHVMGALDFLVGNIKKFCVSEEEI